MKTTVSTYEQQAQQFADKHGVKLTCKWLKYGPYFEGDAQIQHVFKCTLKRAGKSYTFTFGQSIAADATPPNMYDILTCLTKYDPKSFDDFCSDYGYSNDSRSAEKIYKAVLKDWKTVNRLFSDILEELQEIQ